MTELSGRSALVTGGASGIGAACARELAARGATVTVADVDDVGARDLAQDIGGQAWVVDLIDVSSLENLQLETDILVNNAGVQSINSIVDFPPERFRTLLTLMVEAPFLLIRAALPHMYRQKFGRVINISSVHGIRASEYKVAYVTAKHALEGLSKVTALEGGPHDVTSNCVNPGIRPYAAGDQADRRSGPHARHPGRSGGGRDPAEGERDQAAGRAGRGCRPGRLAGLTGRRNGDRRVVHHGRRLERPMTQAVDVPQWQPTERDIADARVTDFARFVQQRTGAPMADYRSLWQWSVDDPAAFWGALWEYFELGDPPDRVLDNAEMPGARWFPGVRLNYVDQIVRNARTDRPAILHVSEDGQITELSWHELLGRTAAFAQTLRSHGVTARRPCCGVPAQHP